MGLGQTVRFNFAQASCESDDLLRELAHYDLEAASSRGGRLQIATTSGDVGQMLVRVLQVPRRLQAARELQLET